MATIKAARPAYIQTNRIYPAQIYSRPAVPAAAVAGNIGYHQRNLLNQYSYTVQQMAVSPFSINNEAYMDRIRREYNLRDRGLYNLYGHIGGFLGAAVGIGFSSGYLRSPKDWILKGQFINKTPKSKYLARREARNAALSSKSNPNVLNYNRAIKKHKDLVAAYNSEVDRLLPLRDSVNNANNDYALKKALKENADETLEKAKQEYKNATYKKSNLKGVTENSKKKIEALNRIDDLTKNADDAADQLKAAIKIQNDAIDAARVAEDATSAALKGLQNADDAFKAVEAGTSVAARTGGLLPSWLGLTADVGFFLLSGAALIDSIKQGDVQGMWINGIATFLDAVSVVGDFFPGIGDAVGGAASYASAGLTGYYMGSTLFKGLSPEGQIAQVNFFKNLIASVQQRPVSTVASLLTMWGVQRVARIGAKRGPNGSAWSRFFLGTGIGNITRSSATMLAMQGVGRASAWVEDQLNMVPDDPAAINFTYGLGIFGDINDNLFGATVRKSQLNAVLNQDKEVTFSDMFNMSWGYTDNEDELFRSVMFADIREGAEVDTGVPVLNSVIDVVGEMLIDPQNYLEAYHTTIRERIVSLGGGMANKVLNRADEVVRLKQAAYNQINPDTPYKVDPVKDGIEEYLVGPEGVLQGPSKNRESFVFQLFYAFLQKRDKGVREVLSSAMTTRTKGQSGKTYETVASNIELQTKLITEMFNDMFLKDGYRSNKYINPAELAGYKKQLEEMARVADNLKHTPTGDEEKDAVKQTAIETMKRFEEHYGEGESLELVNRFIESLGIEHTEPYLKSLYSLHEGVRFHIDMANDLADVSSWLFMPLQKVARFDYARKIFKVLNSKNRYLGIFPKGSAKTIIDVIDLKVEDQKLFDTKDFLEDLNNIPKTKNNLDELTQRSLADANSPIKRMVKDVEDATQPIIQQQAAETNKLNDYEKDLEKRDTQLKESRKQLYVPRNTFYDGKKQWIEIKNEEDARDNLNDAIEFEKKYIDPSGLTPQEWVRRNKRGPLRAAIEKYEAQKIAAVNFFTLNIYYTTFKTVKQKMLFVLSLTSSLNSKIVDETVERVRALGYYTKYIYGNIEKPELDIVEEELILNKRYTKESEINLQKITKELQDAKDTVKKAEDVLNKLRQDSKKITIDTQIAINKAEIEEAEKVLERAYKAEKSKEADAESVQDTHNKNIARGEYLVTRQQKIKNYLAIKKLKGKSWNDKKDFDPETMATNPLTTTHIFNKVKWDKHTELLTEIQRILRKAGVIYKYEESYVDKKTGELKKRKVIIDLKEGTFKLPPGTSLEIEYKTSFTDALYGAIFDALNINDEHIIMSSITKGIKNADGTRLTKEQWSHMTIRERTEFVVELLKTLDLSPAQRSQINRTAVLSIVKAITNIQFENNRRTVQIEEMTSTDIRRSVMSQLLEDDGDFKKQYERVFEHLKKLEERTQKLEQQIKDNPDYNEESRLLLLYLLKNEIQVFNFNYKDLYAYKYIRDNVFKKTTSDVQTGLFLEYDEAKGTVLPSFKDVSKVLSDPNKTYKTMEDALIDYIESPVVQHILTFAEDSMQYAKDIGKHNVEVHRQEVVLERTQQSIDALELELLGYELLTSEEKLKRPKHQIEKELKEKEAELEKANMEYLKIIGDDYYDQSYVDTVQTRKELEAQSTENTEDIEAKVKEETEKIIDSENGENVSGVVIYHPYNNARTVQHTESFKESNRKDPAGHIMHMQSDLFDQGSDIQNYGESRIEIGVTKYYRSSTEELPENYYDILKAHSRTSKGQKQAVRRFAEYLYYKILASKGTLSVDENFLYKKGSQTIGLNTETETGKLESFIRKIVDTYEEGGKYKIILVYKDKRKNAAFNSTKLFHRIVFQETTKYAQAHRNDPLFESYEKDSEGFLTIDSIKKFSKELSKTDSTDKEIITARQTIWNSADKVFASVKVKTNNQLGDVLKHLDIVHNYERTDMQSMSQRYWTVSQDVVIKLTFGNPKMLRLLNNIIGYDKHKESESTLFNFIRMFDEMITENYKFKKPFIISDYKGVLIKGNDVFFITKDNQEESLFDIVYLKKVDLIQIRQALSIWKVDEATRARTEVLYDLMLDFYSDVLTYQPLDLKKTIFMQAGKDDGIKEEDLEKEWEFLNKHANIGSVYQMLTLTTMLRSAPKESIEDNYHERYKIYFDEDVLRLYELSLEDFDSYKLKAYEDTFNRIGLPFNTINKNERQKIVFAVLVLTSKKLKEKPDVQEFLINHIFFNNAYTPKGMFSVSKVNEIKKTLKDVNKSLKGKQVKPKKLFITDLEKEAAEGKTNIELTEQEREVLENKKIRLEQLLKHAEDVRAHTRSMDLQDTKKRFKILADNPKLVNSLFGFYRDTDDPDANFIKARIQNEDGTYQYILVDGNKTANGYNYKETSQGNADINLEVYTELQRLVEDKKITDDLMNIINESPVWHPYKDLIKEIKISKKGVLIIITKDKVVYDSNGEVLFVNADRTKHAEMFKKASILTQALNESKNTVSRFYTVSEKEHTYITSVKDKKDLDTVRTYDAVEIERDGKPTGYYFGEQPDLITTTAGKVVTESFLTDLDFIRNTLKEKLTDRDGNVYTKTSLVDTLVEYAKIYNKRIVPHTSQFSRVSFSASSKLHDLQNTAQSLKMYYTFIQYLKEEGMDINDRNLDMINKYFYQSHLIKIDETGKTIDLNELEKHVDPEAYKEMEKAGLIVAIKNALIKMQDTYKESTYIIDGSHLLPDKFLDTLSDLVSKVYRLTARIQNYGKDIKKGFIPLINRHFAEYQGKTPDLPELQNRIALTNELLRGEGIDPLDHENSLRNPVRKFQKFQEDASRIKKSFKENQSTIMYYGKKQYDAHRKKREADIEAEKRRKNAYLNSKLFWDLTKKFNTQSPLRKHIEIDSPEITTAAEYLNSKLPWYYKLVDSHKGKENPVTGRSSVDIEEILSKLNKEEAELFLVLNYVLESYNGEFSKLRVTNKDEMYNFLVYVISTHYLINVRETAFLDPESMDINPLGKTEEEVQAEIKEKLAKIKNTNRYKPSEDYKNLHPNYVKSIASWLDIDGEQTYTIGNILGRLLNIAGYEGYEKFEEAANNTVNDVEDFIFSMKGKESKNIHVQERVYLKELLRTDNDVDALPHTVKEYIASIIDKDEREAVNAFINAIVYKKEMTDDPETWEAISKHAEKNRGMIKLDEHLKITYSILKRNRVAKTNIVYTSGEVWKYFSMNILNADKKFMEYFLTRYIHDNGSSTGGKNILETLGVKDVEAFKRAKTLEEAVRTVLYTMSAEEMYAFVHAVNTAKHLYIKSEMKGLSTTDKNYWREAWFKFTRKPVRTAEQKLTEMLQLGAFTGPFSSNINKAVYDEINFIFESLSFVKGENDRLKHVMIPLDEVKTEVNTANATFVRQAEAQFQTHARNISREIYSVFFKPENTMSPQSYHYSYLIRTLTNAPIDMVAEAHADSIESVATTNEIYHRIRELFYNFGVSIAGNYLKPKDFFRLSEISAVITTLKENKEYEFWAGVYRSYLQKFSADPLRGVMNKESIEKAARELKNYFNSNGALKEMDDVELEAVMGQLLHKRFGDVYKIEVTELDLYRHKMLILKAKHTVYMNKFNNVLHRLNTAQSDEEAIEIIYGRPLSQLAEDDKKEAKEALVLVRSLRDLIASGYTIKPEFLEDVYVNVINKESPLYQEERTDTILFANAASVAQEMKTTLDENQRTLNERLKDEDGRKLTITDIIKLKETAEIVHARLKKEAEEKANEYDYVVKEIAKEKLELYKSILRNHPELLQDYMGRQTTRFEKRFETLKEKYKTLHETFAPVLIEKANAQIKEQERLDDFFDGPAFKATQSVKGMSRDDLKTGELLLQEHRGYFDYLYIDTPEDALIWLKEMDETIIKMREDQTEHNKPIVTLDDKGVNMTPPKKISSYKKALKAIEDTEGKLEEDLDNTEFLMKDLMEDEEIVKEIVTKFFKNVLNAHNTQDKKTFRETLKGVAVGKFIPASKTAIETKLEARLEKLEKQLESDKKELVKAERFQQHLPENEKNNKLVDKLTKNITRLEVLLKDTKNTLTAIKADEPTTLEALIEVSLKDYLDKHHLSLEGDVEDIVKYLAGETNKELNELYDTVNKEKEKAERAVEAQERLIKKHAYTLSLPKQIEENKKELTQLEKTRVDLEKKMNANIGRHKEEYRHGNSNLGTYKNLFNINVEADLEKQDRRIIKDIIKETTSNSIYGSTMNIDELNKVILSGGVEDIHNPVVDVLVTRLNYMKLNNKTRDDEFYVFDMETIKYNDMELPYQITFLHNQKGGKVTIHHAYFNSIAFHREGNEDTLEIMEFKDRLFESAKRRIERHKSTPTKKYEIPEDEADLLKIKTNEEAERIIQIVQSQKNSKEFIETYIHIFRNSNQNKIPIVTHNGKKFDIPHYQRFVKRFAETLLSNMYYAHIYHNRPEEIMKRFDVSSFSHFYDIDDEGTTKELKAAMSKEVEVTLRRIAKGESITKQELDNMRELTNTIFRINIAQQIKIMEEEAGIHLNKDIKTRLFDPETGEIATVKSFIRGWLLGSVHMRAMYRQSLINYYVDGANLSTNKKQLDYRKEIEDRVDSLLKDAKKQYYSLLEQHDDIVYEFMKVDEQGELSAEGQSRRNMVMNTTLKNNGIEGKRIVYKPQDLIENYQRQIDSKISAKNILKNISENNIKNEIVELQVKQTDINKEVTELKKQVERLDEELVKHNNNSVEYLRSMAGFIKNLQVRTNQLYKQSREVISSVNVQLNKQGKHNVLDPMNEAMINYGLVSTLKEINKIAGELEVLVEVAQRKLVVQDSKITDDAFKELLNKDTQGLYKLEWFKYEKESELRDAEKRLREENVRYEERINDLTKHEEYKDTLFKKELDEQLSIMYTAQREELDRLLAEYEKLYNRFKDEYGLTFVKLPEHNKKTDPLFTEFKKALQNEIKKIFDVIESKGVTNVDKFLLENKELDSLINLIGARGSIRRILNTLNIYTTDIDKFYQTNRTLLISGLEQSISTNNIYINTIKEIRIGKKENNILLAVDQKVQELLKSIKYQDKYQEDIANRSILNIVSNRGLTVEELADDEEALTRLASDVHDKTTLAKLKSANATRLYKDPLANNNKKAFMLDEKITFRKDTVRPDGTKMYVFNFFDKTTQTSNQIIIDTANPGSVRINAAYRYRRASAPLSPITTVKLENLQPKKKVYDYMTESMDILYLDVNDTIENFHKKHTPGLSSEMVYKLNGTDGSFESIKRLLKFFNTYIEPNLKGYFGKGEYDKLSSEEKNKKFEDVFAEALTKSVDHQELHLKYIEQVDMTKYTEDMFLEYIKVARTTAGGASFRDAAGVYQGLSDALLAKYGSMVPGKILNLIDPEFSTTFILKYDDEELAKKNIMLYDASEGSMGNSFAEITPFTPNVPFKHNTNAIRIALPFPKHNFKYTATGITNVLYLAEDAMEQKPKDYISNLMSNFEYVMPEKIKGVYNWDNPKVFLKNKTVQNLSAVKDKKDIVMVFTQKRVERLRDLLGDDTSNPFIPNVLSKDDLFQYQNDRLHKRGVNLKVTFSNDIRAFEDVILMDYDDAVALGWDKGNKTWLGSSYGFKGGVQLIRGLRDQYGSTFVASASSVIKRGAYGALVEMIFSNFKESFKDPSHAKGLMKTLIESYKNKDSVIHKYVTLDGDFAIVKSNVDYTEFFNETSLFGAIKKGETKEDRLNRIFTELLKPDRVNTTSYEVRKGEELVKVTPNGEAGWQGKLYVFMDAEHTADHMTNKAEVRNFGAISVARVDSTGTVLNGVVLSVSVLYPMLAKSSKVNFAKAFFDEDDPTKLMVQNKKVILYTDIAEEGITYILKEYGVKKAGSNQYNIEETLKNLSNAEINSNIIDYVRTYLMYEIKFADDLKIDGELLEEVTFVQAELNQKIRREAEDFITGDSGQLSNAVFKKHFGGRQQLLANTSLKMGTAITNNAIWKNNISKDATWVQKEVYDLKEFNKEILEVSKNELGLEWKTTDSGYTITVKDEDIEAIQLLLNRNGIIRTARYTDVLKVTRNKDDDSLTFTIPKKVERVFGYVLSMRSPVQDYNAVSLIKIIGYHDHDALEADKYLYLRISGDNDGDTLGMIAVNEKQYEHLKDLDATKKEFYDRNYFDAVDKGVFKTKKLESGKEEYDTVLDDKGVLTYAQKTQDKVQNISIVSSNVGKHMYSSFKNSKGEREKIRNLLTTDELYILAFEDTDLEKQITKNNDKLIALLPEAKSVLSKDVTLLRAYVNAYIRRLTGGYDNFRMTGKLIDATKNPLLAKFNTNDGYASKESLLALLNDKEIGKDIIGRYVFSTVIENGTKNITDFIKLESKHVYQMFNWLDKDDKKYLNDTYHLYTDGREVNQLNKVSIFLSSTSEKDIRIKKEIISNKLLSKMMQGTTERVSTSKNGIEQFGSNRKLEFISSMVARFSLVNKDYDGHFWDVVGAYKEGALTPMSLMHSLFEVPEGETFEVGKKTLEEFKEDAQRFVKQTFEYEGETYKLFDLFKDISGTEQTGEELNKYIEQEIKEFINEVATIVYNAYKYSDKAKVLFPALYNALNKKDKNYTVYEFLNESFIDAEYLLPAVAYLRNHKKESYSARDLEWIKIQFFGANRQEGNKFFSMSQDNKDIKDLVDSYSAGYLNEHIIGRREFRNMSDMASEVIAVAKHQGADINVTKWIQAYITRVVAEATEHSVRKTNLDNERAYLNYAIAMDRNPFEDNEELLIKDETYQKLLDKRKSSNRQKQAVLKPYYNNESEAKINLNDLSQASFDIQMFGRYNVHSKIRSVVKDNLIAFAKVFKKYDISNPIELQRAAIEAEPYAVILASFNIVGYKLRNFVHNYIFNYMYINNVLGVNNKPLIHFDARDPLVNESNTVMEVLYKMGTRENREDYETLLGSSAPMTNKFLQSDIDLDLTYYYINDDGEVKRRGDKTNPTSTIKVERDYVQEQKHAIMLGRGEIPTVLDTRTDPKEDKLLELSLRQLSLNVTAKHHSFESTLDNLLSEYDSLRAAYYRLTEQQEELKNRKYATPEDKKRSAVHNKVYDTRRISSDIINLSITEADYNKNKEQKLLVEKLIKQKEIIIGSLEEQIRLLEQQKKNLSNLRESDELIKTLDEDIKELRERQDKVKEDTFNYVFNQTFNELTPLLHTKEGYTIKNLYTFDKPRYLSVNDVEEFNKSRLMQLHYMISPFINTVAVWKNYNTNEWLWKDMYKWYQSNYNVMRLVILRGGDDNEGLLKNHYDFIFEPEEVTDKKGKKKIKYNKMFKDGEAYAEFMQKLTEEKETQRTIRFNNQEYGGIDLDVTADKFITPTMKELNIRNAKDLERVFNFIQNNPKHNYFIGFVSLDNVMDAHEQSYLPFRHTGFGSDFLGKLYHMSKFVQRLSLGFVVRNWVDTWNQLYSEAQLKYGVLPALFKIPQIVHIMMEVSKIKSVYHRVSLDRALYLTAFKGHYQEIEEVITSGRVITMEEHTMIKEHIENIKAVLMSYRDAELDTDEFSGRVYRKQMVANNLVNRLELLLKQIDTDNQVIKSNPNINLLKSTVTFIGSMQFAEYFTMYEHLVDVFTAAKWAERKNENFVQRLKKQQGKKFKDFKSDLFEISAFMQTNAQLDEYQQNQSKLVKDTLDNLMNPTLGMEKDYNTIAKEIDKGLSDQMITFKQALFRTGKGILSTALVVPVVKDPSKLGLIGAVYNWSVSDTETTGRIAGYLLDKYLHSLTFEQSVNKSLTRFFNYGMRSPIELNYMLADIPYLSFPLRSIDNWINRLTDPNYMRYLTDIIDGLYGQYTGEDGQYDEFMQYQIANGWLPIANGVGLRIGNGAFDVAQFLTDPAGELRQRRSPLGRMITAIGEELMGTRDQSLPLASEIIKQSAAVGFATRAVNQLSGTNPALRDTLRSTPGINTIVDTRPVQSQMQGYARGSSVLYWYEQDFQKYTPKKYDYSQGNGRYKYYENIYRDWFNKYGKMRKPKVDPYSLVKDIQWKNYVRWRRQNYMNKY